MSEVLAWVLSDLLRLLPFMITTFLSILGSVVLVIELKYRIDMKRINKRHKDNLKEIKRLASKGIFIVGGCEP